MQPMLCLQKRRRRPRRGQATLEFAFTFPLYLIVFFASIDAALWAIQTSAAVTAAEVAARLAAAVEVCDNPSCLTNPTIDTRVPEGAPAAADVTTSVRQRLQEAMFGTTVVPWCEEQQGKPPAQRTAADCKQTGAYSQCPTTPDQVLTSNVNVGGGGGSDRTVAVCVEEAPPCAAPCSADVTVRIIGYLASLVPPAFGLGWKAGQIPINVGARIHAQRFNP